MRRLYATPFGAQLDADGARFRLWAPRARSVAVNVRTESEELEADLNKAGDGWFELNVTGVHAGAAYSYRIDGGIEAPDPASRFNPDGPQGRSVLVDPRAFDWRDDGWRGRPWREAVVYEMHVGCFTAEGTYAAAVERLDALADFGVTALELMPLSSFPGARGWGYDGVLPFAPHPAYGRPEDLKRFIEAAHARGLMVLIDVVYNHFGPEGNYLPQYAPEFFTKRHRTPWGDAIDFAHPVVRLFFLSNALYWLDEYRFDGLRVDAIHAIHDDSPKHFIDELIETVHGGPGRERCVHVVLENERNEARWLRRRRPTYGAGGSPGSKNGGAASDAAARAAFDCGLAQWNDDFHHALHVAIAGEADGYYIDYADRPLERLGRILTEGFAYQGERSTFAGEPRGERSGDLPPTAFVSFLQNHDQIGNRAFGERLTQLAEPDALRAAQAILLLAPQIPMLFMGEEYGATQPFLYFCDFRGELAAAVRDGRRAEFGRFGVFADERARERIPDPNASETFERSRLDWSDRVRSPHAQTLDYVRTLLDVRRRAVTPLINAVVPGGASFETHGRVLKVRWPLRDGGALALAANLGEADAPSAERGGNVLHSIASEPVDDRLRAWEVRLARL